MKYEYREDKGIIYNTKKKIIVHHDINSQSGNIIAELLNRIDSLEKQYDEPKKNLVEHMYKKYKKLFRPPTGKKKNGGKKHEISSQ